MIRRLSNPRSILPQALLSFLAALMVFASPLRAQFLDPVSFRVAEAPGIVRSGESFTIVLDATIDGDWHLYSILNAEDAGPFPTRFSLKDGLAYPTGPARESEAVIEFDPNFEVDLGWHSTSARFFLPVAIKESAAGEAMISIDVRYQACDDTSCLPPKTKTVTLPVTVASASEQTETIQIPDNAGIATSDGTGWIFPVDAVAASATGTASGSAEGAVQTSDERRSSSSGSPSGSSSASALGRDGILAFLWIAITAGFAALLTPCVFPMIPLTVSFFSKPGTDSQPPQPRQAGSESVSSTTRIRGRSPVAQAMIFGVSIIATFTILGALLALVIGVSGANRFASNPWVNLFIGSVLVFFGISLLGFFEIRLPYRLTNWLNRQSNERSGGIGILFMALTISAVSFSCTAPFVGAVLAATAGGEWFYPIVGMIGFSAAFASPFVILALFPEWLQSLPKSGSWMNLVKVSLGFIELAAALKFISNADLVWSWGLVSRPFAIALWIALFLLAGFHLLGVFTMSGSQRPETVTPGRVVASVPFLTLSIYLIPGLMGASLGIWDSWLPPKQATDVSVVMSVRSALDGARIRSAGDGEAGTGEADWSEDYDASLRRALEERRPVFVDFTGYTCTNCRAMETNVFPLAETQERFDRFELVRLYTDDGRFGPEHQKRQFELTGTVALPTYAIVDPADGRLLDMLVGYVPAETFQAFLDRGFETYQSGSAP